MLSTHLNNIKVKLDHLPRVEILNAWNHHLNNVPFFQPPVVAFVWHACTSRRRSARAASKMGNFPPGLRDSEVTSSERVDLDSSRLSSMDLKGRGSGGWVRVCNMVKTHVKSHEREYFEQIVWTKWGMVLMLVMSIILCMSIILYLSKVLVSVLCEGLFI